MQLFQVHQLVCVDFYSAGFAISDATIRRIATQCPFLRSLRIVDCVCLTDTQIQFLTKRCTLLASLEIEDCKYVSDTGLNAITTNLKTSLRSIILKGKGNYVATADTRRTSIDYERWNIKINFLFS